MAQPLNYYASIIGPEPQAFDEFLRSAVDYYNAKGNMNGFAWPKPAPKPNPDVPVYGVDVSHWQGVIDWPKVAACVRPVISFAIIKATEGDGLVDPTARANIKGAAAAGLRVGLYHFYRAYANPVSQARLFGRLIDEAIESGVDVDRLAIDIETDLESYTAAGLKAFLDELRTNRPACLIYIYTRANIWNLLPAKEQETFGCPLWVANWVKTENNVPIGGSSPKIPTAWGTWTIWQYASGIIDGINKGPVDLNVIAGIRAK